MGEKTFLDRIKPENRVYIIHHNDADGVCSAGIVGKYLKSRKVYPTFVSQPIPPKKATFHSISWEDPDYVIVLDIALDQSRNLLDVFDCPVLIIDHHVSKDLSSRKVTHINPRFENPDIYQSASYLVYKLLGEKEYAWVAAVGAIGDFNTEDSQDLFQDLEDYKKEELGFVSNVIASVKAVEGRKGCEEFAQLLSEVGGVKELFRKGKRFLEENNTIDEEIDRVMRDFEKNKEVKGKVTFYHMESKYRIRSIIATKLPVKNVNAIYEGEGNNHVFSLRSKEVDLTKVLDRVLEKVDGSGGGHPQAAGATIPAEFADDFKREFAREVNAS